MKRLVLVIGLLVLVCISGVLFFIAGHQAGYALGYQAGCAAHLDTVLANRPHFSGTINRSSSYIIFWDSSHTLPYKLNAPLYQQIPHFQDSLWAMFTDGQIILGRINKGTNR